MNLEKPVNELVDLQWLVRTIRHPLPHVDASRVTQMANALCESALVVTPEEQFRSTIVYDPTKELVVVVNIAKLIASGALQLSSGLAVFSNPTWGNALAFIAVVAAACQVKYETVLPEECAVVFGLLVRRSPPRMAQDELRRLFLACNGTRDCPPGLVLDSAKFYQARDKLVELRCVKITNDSPDVELCARVRLRLPKVPPTQCDA
jgi:hypothetical protein